MNTQIQHDSDDLDAAMESLVTYVTVRTITGDIGCGWDDYNAAEIAWQERLRDELYACLSERYPEAEVTIEVSLASGDWTRIETDACDFDEGWLHEITQNLFLEFCNA